MVKSADWWRGAIIYQIYPRSYADSNGDGVGDLPGIIAKLDHIASLGVDGVWLSPFFRSPMKDFGYDVSDYRDVDPLFGTLADFDYLLAKAHALGLKVIIDQVWSHSSDRHPWFIESAASRDNPKADWYVWADAKADGSPPNNWQAEFGGPSWTWNQHRRQYYFHNFLVEQPDLNYWNPAVQDEILDIARFWLDRGVDGFRLDVINFIVHDRELRDNPPAPLNRPAILPTRFQTHLYDRTRPEAFAFIARLRRLIDGYEARMTVGETGELEVQQAYTLPPDRLHTAYSFFLLNARSAPPALFAQALAAWADAPGWPSWSLGNHDIARFATRLNRSGDPRHVRALMVALLALRGTIFLYQGEELGLPQARVPFERLRDPFDIAAFGGEAGRDGARTPMPWTSTAPNAGFTTARETWLPVDPAHLPLSVAAQEADADSMLLFTRRFIAVRQASAALRLGAASVAPAPENLLVVHRRHGDDQVLCVIELAGEASRFDCPPGWTILAAISGGEAIADGALVLPPFGGAVLASRNDAA
jgi:alpha-glucosidase